MLFDQHFARSRTDLRNMAWPREVWCNGSLQRWTSHKEGRCDLCHRLCRAYPKRTFGCGVEHHKDCDCKEGYGRFRVGAGRPWTLLSDHECKVEMQRRRVRQAIKRMAKIQEDFQKRQQQQQLVIATESKKLHAIESGSDERIEEAPPMRKPCPTGISMEALGRACVGLRSPGFAVMMPVVPNMFSDWSDAFTKRKSM